MMRVIPEDSGSEEVNGEEVVEEEEDEVVEEEEEYDEDMIWKTWTIFELGEDHLLCWDEDRSPNKGRGTSSSSIPLIPSMATWSLLRSTYHSVLSTMTSPTTAETLRLPRKDYGNININKNEENEYGGFQVDVITKNTQSKGRGNYANQFIPKGTLIWTSIYTAEFQDGASYREFLRRLPPSLACDILIWAYTRRAAVTPSTTTNGMVEQRLGEDDMVVCVDLDPGSFTNDADTDEELNMALIGQDQGQRNRRPSERHPIHPSRTTGCHLEFYATRDIQLGEEITIDYDFSEGNRGWAKLGLAPWHTVDAYEDKEDEELEDEEEEDDDEDGEVEFDSEL